MPLKILNLLKRFILGCFGHSDSVFVSFSNGNVNLPTVLQFGQLMVIFSPG
jgi:hypothetical protein